MPFSSHYKLKKTDCKTNMSFPEIPGESPHLSSYYQICPQRLKISLR